METGVVLSARQQESSNTTVKVVETGMMVQTDRWLQLAEIAKMFGLSEESIKRLAKTHGLPLRRVTPFATPGTLESELVRWLKAQPRIGAPVRSRNSRHSKGSQNK